MRRKLHQQLPLTPPTVDHVHGRELAAISKLLDEQSDALQHVHADLTRGGKLKETGRNGMSAEQVLRAVVLKQMHGISYEELSFHLVDSVSSRAFCRIGVMDRAPKKSALQKNIKMLSAETFEAINRALVTYARREEIESGEKARFDCTVTASNIHEPQDSWQLWDVVRVLTRLMGQAKERFDLHFGNHTRRAKRRFIAIINAKTASKRKTLYRDLLRVAGQTLDDACRVATELRDVRAATMPDMLLAQGLTQELRHFITLGQQVWEQTHRRVLFEEDVAATDKVVSIFEEHTDIIVKDRRDTHFGHKLCLSTGASNLVLDCVVLEGNPADSTLACKMVQRHKELYEAAPRQAAFDGGFASRANLDELKAAGVEDVAFSKGRNLPVEDMVSSPAVFKMLRNFRAGIEAGISMLKRCFGLRRCTWRGFASFKAYVWASIVSANLLVLARHALKPAT